MSLSAKESAVLLVAEDPDASSTLAVAVRKLVGPEDAHPYERGSAR